MELLAKTFYGLEDVLVQELSEIGAEQIVKHNRAVSFHGNQELLYRANLSLRTALRILKPIYVFEAANEEALYQGIQQIAWSNFIGSKNTLAVDSVLNTPNFNHTRYAAQKVKDAIVDQFRSTTGSRPTVDTDDPDLRINVHIFKDQCTVSLDSSGDSLHKRGYRSRQGRAPLNEVLAAGMVLLSGWDGKGIFMDPMCGSGTILAEALMYACKIPPSANRKHFGFMKWKDFDADLYRDIIAENNNRMVKPGGRLIGGDISRQAIYEAGENVKNIHGGAGIEFITASFKNLMPPEEGGLAVINPPYGERMGSDDIYKFYKSIGDRLKEAYNGYEVWLLSSNKEALKHVGLRTSAKHTLFNGPLECKFQKFSIYKGSKKLSKPN